MIKSVDLKFYKISLRDAVVLLHFFRFNKQMLKDHYFKTLKGRRICNIDCERVNIPDKLRHSKRHVIQSSFSFSFNNQ